MKSHVWKFLFALALAVTLIALKDPIIDWFLGADDARSSPRGHAPDAHSPLPDNALATLRGTLAPYETIRAALAGDSLDGVAESAEPLAKRLEQAFSPIAGSAPSLAPLMVEGSAAALGLVKTTDLEHARKLFATVSRAILTAASHAPELMNGKHVFNCPMTGGYGRWFQPTAEIANPYMGARMLSCGGPVALEPVAAVDGISHYTCPMHPSVKQAGPGKCPLCGMDLTPVTRASLASGELTLDPAMLERTGVHSEPVTRGPMTRELRTVGRITYDESTLTDVTLKVGGFIRSLKVNEPGQTVKKGEVLFTLYSPELLAAQRELLIALDSGSASLVNASRERLRLWDVTAAQLESVEESRRAIEALPFRAPVSGVLVEKDVVEGAAVEPGMRLYRIAQLDTVWVAAQLYEGDLAQVKVGQRAQVTLPHAPGKSFSGKVVQLSPSLSGVSRTAEARIALKNPDGALRPEMFADVTFTQALPDRLQVPITAIVYTGPRRLVFVDAGEGRLVPREVVLGQRVGDRYEVLEGLREGERVVTRGNFLVASESRLRSLTGELLPSVDAGTP